MNMAGRDQRGSKNPNWRGGRKQQGDGYVYIHLPSHPRADIKGYVLEHILIVERALGRPLPQGAQVHHANEREGDNRNQNLVICENQTYHQLLHKRKRALDLGFPARWLKCRLCKLYDDPETMWVSRKTRQGQYHRACLRNRSLRIKAARATILEAL